MEGVEASNLQPSQTEFVGSLGKCSCGWGQSQGSLGGLNLYLVGSALTLVGGQIGWNCRHPLGVGELVSVRETPTHLVTDGRVLSAGIEAKTVSLFLKHMWMESVTSFSERIMWFFNHSDFLSES